MKTFKLLAALALPAMFAACTNEEILVESPIQGEEVVGAELIGTDISLNVGLGSVESRFNNGWETTDNLGLGWTTVGAYNSTQNLLSGSNPTTPGNEIVANHMFAKADVNSPFSTKGNIYKGWHFAYYPYERMDQIGTKVVELNPAQEEEWSAAAGARFNNRFAVSARQFLTAADINEETNQLDKNVVFNAEWATNEIAIHLIPSGNFITNKYLNDLAIQSVTLQDKTSSKKYFAPTATLYPSSIPTVLNKDGVSIYKKGVKDVVVSTAKTKEALLNAIPNILQGTYVNAITTKINIDMKTATGGSTRIFALPYVNAGSIKAITLAPKFTISVEGGYFEITKVLDAEEGSLAAANNAELDKLIAAYATDGKFTNAQNIGSTQQVSLNLYPEIFHPYFEEIDNYTEWQKCVNIIDALGFTTEQNFVLTGDIDVTGTTIKMPKKCKLNVTSPTGKKISIKKTLKSFPTADMLNIASVDLVFDADNTLSNEINAKTITNNATMTIAEGTVINPNEVEIDTNNGTIIVNKYAEVNGVNNEDGRIEIIYGGIANASPEGVIYYNVTGSEPAYKINYLMEHGNVNTFVVNSGVEFDVTKKFTSGTFEDEYVPSAGITDPINAAALATKKIELNGGVITAKPNSGVSVANVEVVGGETNELWNIDVTEKLSATEGLITVDAAQIGNYKESLNIQNIEVTSELVANVNIYTKNISNPIGAKTTVNSGYAIYYTDNYVQGGIASGIIEKIASMPGLGIVTDAVNNIIKPSSVTAEAIGTDIYTYITGGSFKNGETIVLPDGEIVFQANNQVEYHNKNVTFVGGENTVIKISEKGLKVRDGQLTLKNLTIDAGNSFGVYAKENSIVNLQNVKIETTGAIAILAENASLGIDENTATINAYNLTIPNTSTIQFFTLWPEYNSWNKTSYFYFNYEGGNITNAMVKAQAGAKSTGYNAFVNNVAVPAN